MLPRSTANSPDLLAHGFKVNLKLAAGTADVPQTRGAIWRISRCRRLDFEGDVTASTQYWTFGRHLELAGRRPRIDRNRTIPTLASKASVPAAKRAHSLPRASHDIMPASR